MENHVIGSIAQEEEQPHVLVGFGLFLEETVPFVRQDLSHLFHLFPCETTNLSSLSSPEIQRFKRIIYIQRDDPSFSSLQVMGIIRRSATCVVGLFHHKTCEQHLSCFQSRPDTTVIFISTLVQVMFLQAP